MKFDCYWFPSRDYDVEWDTSSFTVVEAETMDDAMTVFHENNPTAYLWSIDPAK